MYYFKNKNIVSEKIDGEYIVFNTEKEAFYELDEIGSFIWDLIDNTSDEQILSAVTGSYDVSCSQAKEDIRAFITQLVENGLILAKDL